MKWWREGDWGGWGGGLGNHDIKKAVEQGPSLNELFMDAVKEKEPQTLKVPGQVIKGVLQCIQMWFPRRPGALYFIQHLLLLWCEPQRSQNDRGQQQRRVEPLERHGML